MRGWRMEDDEGGRAHVGEGEVRDKSLTATPSPSAGVNMVIYAPSAPDRCPSKTEGCWGVKEAINILSAQVSLSASLYTNLSFSLALCHFPFVHSCMSFSLTHIHLSLLLLSSTLQHRVEAANHSNTVSDLYIQSSLLA